MSLGWRGSVVACCLGVLAQAEPAQEPVAARTLDLPAIRALWSDLGDESGPLRVVAVYRQGFEPVVMLAGGASGDDAMRPPASHTWLALENLSELVFDEALDHAEAHGVSPDVPIHTLVPELARQLDPALRGLLWRELRSEDSAFAPYRRWLDDEPPRIPLEIVAAHGFPPPFGGSPASELPALLLEQAVVARFGGWERLVTEVVGPRWGGVALRKSTTGRRSEVAALHDTEIRLDGLGAWLRTLLDRAPDPRWHVRGEARDGLVARARMHRSDRSLLELRRFETEPAAIAFTAVVAAPAHPVRARWRDLEAAIREDLYPDGPEFPFESAVGLSGPSLLAPVHESLHGNWSFTVPDLPGEASTVLAVSVPGVERNGVKLWFGGRPLRSLSTWSWPEDPSGRWLSFVGSTADGLRIEVRLVSRAGRPTGCVIVHTPDHSVLSWRVTGERADTLPDVDAHARVDDEAPRPDLPQTLALLDAESRVRPAAATWLPLGDLAWIVPEGAIAAEVGRGLDPAASLRNQLETESSRRVCGAAARPSGACSFDEATRAVRTPPRRGARGPCLHLALRFPERRGRRRRTPA